MRKTALLLAPTLEEVRLAAAKIGLPQREADKFFYHYESNGWKVGRVRMASFSGALAGWKLRYEERAYLGGAPSNGEAPQNGKLTSAQLVMYQKEYERVLERMRLIRASYGEMQTWSAGDKALWMKLRDRKNYLKKLLGIMI